MANNATIESYTSVIDLDTYAETTIYHKVDRLIGHCGFTEDDRDDLQQDLALDLIQGLKHFDPARARRSTFITRCIEHRITDIIRHRHRARRDARRVIRIENADGGKSCDQNTGSLTDKTSEHERQRSDLRIDVSAVIASMPSHLAHICEMLPTHSPFAISRELGISKRSVYRDVAAIRELFVGAGLQIYMPAGKSRTPAA